jgi:DNA-binding CsgD family transcriptional regulator
LPYRKTILKLTTGKTFVRSRDYPDKLYLRSHVYQEHFKNLGIHYVMHHCLFDSPKTAIGITFTRPEELERFAEADRAAFGEIAGHLSRSIALFVKCRQASTDQLLLVESWRSMPQAALVVTSVGKLLFSNEAANQLLEEGVLKCEKYGSISLPSHRDTTLLHSLVNGAIEQTAGHDKPFGGTLYVNRPESGEPLVLNVAPFRESAGQGISKRYALVLINDPAREHTDLEDGLRQAFHLTRAEARIAVMLSKGHSIKETADILAISNNTVRTHLKRVFGKTSTHRQSALVRRILSLK